MNNYYKEWDNKLFGFTKKWQFEKEIYKIRNIFKKGNIEKKDYPIRFYQYISSLKFYGTLFCDDFEETDYYEFMEMKNEILEIYTFIRTHFFNYSQQADNKINNYFEDLDKIEKFLNKNLEIDHEADKEVEYWIIKKRYFNEIQIEDDYSDSEEATENDYSDSEEATKNYYSSSE